MQMKMKERSVDTWAVEMVTAVVLAFFGGKGNWD
jgi:succinate dehydrogenase hydrophobic anchor subunit